MGEESGLNLMHFSFQTLAAMRLQRSDVFTLQLGCSCGEKQISFSDVYGFLLPLLVEAKQDYRIGD